MSERPRGAPRVRWAVLILAAAAAAAAGKSARPTPASSAPIAFIDETQYIVFAVSLDGVWEAPRDARFDLIDRAVADLVKRIGVGGAGDRRRLGFLMVVPVWIVDRVFPAEVPSVIHEAFRVAKSRNVALQIAIESHYFWDTRSDLWNCFDPGSPGYDPENRDNVESSDWAGTAYPFRFVDWGAPQKLPPHMCYSSPRILSEVDRLATEVLGGPIRKELDDLRAEGRADLLAGVTVTSEPSIDNYSVVDAIDPALGRFMDSLGAPKVRLGYSALRRAGYTAANPPEDVTAALAEINRKFVSRWAEGFVRAGLPPSRLYTHVSGAVGASGSPVLDFTNAPLSVAFNEFSRPCWTTYPAGSLSTGLQPLYDELARHGGLHWGGTEASPALFDEGIEPWEYLSWHFDHGATVVVMNTGATSPELAEKLQNGVFSERAISAYRRFLSEQPRRIAPVDSQIRGGPPKEHRP